MNNRWTPQKVSEDVSALPRGSNRGGDKFISDRLQRTQLRLIRGNKDKVCEASHFERKKLRGCRGGKGRCGMVFRTLSNSSERGWNKGWIISQMWRRMAQDRKTWLRWMPTCFIDEKYRAWGSSNPLDKPAAEKPGRRMEINGNMRLFYSGY